MSEPIANSAASATLTIAAAASLLTLGRLLAKRLNGQPLLRYEPRRPVPWTGWPALVLLSPLLLSLLGKLILGAEPTVSPLSERWTALTVGLTAPIAGPSGAAAAGAGATVTAALTAVAPSFVREGSFLGAALLMTMLQVTVTAATYVALAAVAGASRLDLGLPADVRQFWGDVRIGGIAFLAALLPTYALQVLLNWLLQPQSGHPFVEQFMATPSVGIMTGIALAAVVGAPVFEETAFRLLLQGWLEKPAGRLQADTVAVSTDESEIERAPIDDHGNGQLVVTMIEQVDAPATADAVAGAANSGGDASLPAGANGASMNASNWPIAVTAVAFGLAHWGHGASPAPLVLLGLVLGYLYSRTHRIVPAIACHMLFNALTMWLLLLEYLQQ
ncbi:MAG: hypothetical protein CMJ58_16180 [Planctomycetaceae bacterium]|nr:hypothetical protein [Planctomycetaceae bacterium]